MGIVAYCPNDHRVKVKNDLAGKKGICPTCGARFRIPLESQPDRKRMGIEDPVPAEAPLPSWVPVAAPTSVPASAPFPDPAPTLSPVPPPAPVPPSTPVIAHNPPSGIPIAEIVSLDGAVAASLPRALPLATRS